MVNGSKVNISAPVYQRSMDRRAPVLSTSPHGNTFALKLYVSLQYHIHQKECLTHQIHDLQILPVIYFIRYFYIMFIFIKCTLKLLIVIDKVTLLFGVFKKKDEVMKSCKKVDLFKSLVILWIVNTVNELIHLRHIIHQNPLYYPSVLKLFQNLKSILYEL